VFSFLRKGLGSSLRRRGGRLEFYDLAISQNKLRGESPSIPSKSIGLKGTPHPHDVQNVGVRGLFADDAFIALYVCGTLDFDGALGSPLFNQTKNRALHESHPAPPHN